MKKHFVATGYVVREGKTLLLFHKKLRMWLPPGGHIDSGEDPEEALLREIQEETGLAVKIVAEKRGHDPSNSRVHYLYRPRHLQLENVGDHEHIDLIYFCQAVSGEPRLAHSEHEQMKWFSVRDLQSAEIEEEVRESAALAIQELSEVNDLGLRTQDLGLKKTVVLLSGGLDSATALYWAMSKGFSCRALSVRYGQRHFRELESARQVAEKAGVPFEEVSLDLTWFKDSTLVDSQKSLPDNPLEKIGKDGIPSTYVPGRNTLFLSLAVSLADSTGGDSIVIGANILDYSGYPDCRPEFYRAYEEAAGFGTKSGVEGVRIAILTPLIKMTKAQIVRLATELRVPLELTWSCYAGGERPCGKCDSCKLRAKGFEEAGVSDPALEMV